MQRLFYLIQYVAPIAGLFGITMIVLGIKGTPQNWALVQQCVPLVILAFVFRPRPDHPMHEFLGMRSSRRPGNSDTSKDTPEAKEAKAFLAEMIEQNIAVLEHEPGDLPHHAAPAELVPLLPGAKEQGRSWIGGAPMLPEDMAWPEANGSPMLFVAQIALDELPEGIWGDLGPRDGWLAFFMPSEGRIDDDSRVFHLTGPVATRAWPEVPHSFYFSKSGKAREALAAVGFSIEPHPPRFPVAIRHHDGSSRSARSIAADDNQRFAIQNDYDPRSLTFRPFDTSSARGLVASLVSGQRQALDKLGRDIERMEQDLQKSESAEDQAKLRSRLAVAQEEQVSRDAAIAALEEIHAKLLARPDGAISTVDVDDLIEELDGLVVRKSRKRDGEVKWSSHSVIDEYWARPVSREVFEMQVQEAMRTHPDRVSDATRTRYEKLWRFDQEREYATMGGPVHTGFIYSRARNPVFLLEVPSSDLVGWMFGDVASLGMFIDPEDMKAGRWDKAWGDILN